MTTIDKRGASDAEFEARVAPFEAAIETDKFLANLRAALASPAPAPQGGEIAWSKHRGSCRVFYAERRCTCGATA